MVPAAHADHAAAPTETVTEPVLIRRARGADVPAILSLIHIGTRSGKILKRSPTDVRRNLKGFRVVEDAGRIVACGSLEVYSRKLAEVRSLSVHPDCRRRGIASALIAEFLKEARRRRVYEVLAITDRERLFKRQGFADQLHGQSALFSRPGGRR
jgi:amino-acid N-acetyltransferase